MDKKNSQCALLRNTSASFSEGCIAYILLRTHINMEELKLKYLNGIYIYDKMFPTHRTTTTQSAVDVLYKMN